MAKVKLECLADTWRVDPKTGYEVRYDDMPEDGSRGPSIYEVDEKVAEELLATGNFKKVE